MKKHTIFYLLFCILFIGCTDESLNISRIERANNAPPASIIGIDDELEAKKGIGMAYREPTWSSRIARLKPFWHYAYTKCSARCTATPPRGLVRPRRIGEYRRAG